MSRTGCQMREDFKNNANYSDFFSTENLQIAKNLSGNGRENLDVLGQEMGVKVNRIGSKFTVNGPQESAVKALNLLKSLAGTARSNTVLTPDMIREMLAKQANQNTAKADAAEEAAPNPYGDEFAVQTPNLLITPRNDRQVEHMRNFRDYMISFATGSAGTGKTYLSIALAVAAFKRDEFKQILISRPAVDAGEKLGYLPGGAKEKVDPYMRPIYDALHEMLGKEETKRLIKAEKIEIAPIAYMRGRNIKDTIMVIDEAQNMTVEQTHMVMTRLDKGSKLVLTGAENQIDLDKSIVSGLVKVMKLLSTPFGKAAAPDIATMRYLPEDVVRLPVVKQVEDLFAQELDDEAPASEPQAQAQPHKPNGPLCC